MRNRRPNIEVTARRRIEAADEAQLIGWAERVLSAASLDDVLVLGE